MARNDNDVKVVDTITIGDQVYDKDSVTPSTYFEYVKGMKQKLVNHEHEIIIDTALTMLKKTKLTGQTEMAKELTHQIELAMRELEAAADGFDIFVDRKTLEKYIKSVEQKSVKIIEIERYEREIPDEILDKLELARKHFDRIYIVFTDYTEKQTKKVAKERRDKDPIMFGAFVEKDASSSKIYVEDRMFFIADWVEEKCELTLEEMVRDVKDKTGEDITYRVTNPKDAEEVKSMIESFKHPMEENKDMKPVSLFDKIKQKVTRKKKSESSDEAPKKRGRKKKTEE